MSSEREREGVSALSALSSIRGRVWWIGLALGLLGVGALRAAPWLFVLCVVGAAVAASLAVVARRSVYGLFFDMIAVPVEAIGSIPWVAKGVRGLRQGTAAPTQRVWWSVFATVVLLLVFVPLLAGADAVFASFVEDLVPPLDSDVLWRWVFVFAVAASGTAGALFLLAGPPRAAEDAPGGRVSWFGVAAPVAGQRDSRRLSRIEWGLPMGALTLLFVAFLGTRLVVMFGGDDYVQRTGGLTYAEYAQSGFWQLSIVSMLTLAVIAVVQRWAAQDEGVDRLWLRIGVAAVSVLTLVIVASALQRMWIYQQAYGFTVLRVLVEVFEVWIGVVYLLVLASLVRLRREWVPRAGVGTAAATLLVLAIVNPEHLVADRNIDRFEAGKTLDIEYLRELSPDILPAIDRLPEPQRSAIAKVVRAKVEEDTWQGWNLSRSSARN